MNSYITAIRKPVKRIGGEHYLLITLLSFAFSISLTRMFLALTGYPQVGNGTLHIAHLLWGGLLLFAASLLPLIYANRWVYRLEAILAGVGVGLFIDEVGKFITRTNDYFYPAAAPIIYAFFLLTVLVYLRARRPPNRDARTEMYVAFDSLQEVLDHDLDAKERADLKSRLQYVVEQKDDKNLSRLGSELLEYLANDEIDLAPDRPGRLTLWIDRVRAFEQKYFNRIRYLITMEIGLAGLGIFSLVSLIQLIVAAISPRTLDHIVSRMTAAGRLGSQGALVWFFISLGLEGMVGLFLISSVLLLFLKNERRAIPVAYLTLLLNLTTVDLLNFYYDQFSTIIPAVIQFLILLAVLYYRQRYIRSDQEFYRTHPV